MVRQLLGTSNNSEPTNDPESLPSFPDQQERGSGCDIVGVLKDQYPTVVEDIMENIRQLRSDLSSKDDKPEVEVPIIDVRNVNDECIFGLPIAYSKDTILSQYMPLQEEAERLLAIYFGGNTFIQPFVHAQYFQRQYRNFQSGHFLTASAFWLSTLFSIFSISAMAPGAVSLKGNAETQSHRFQTAAGQCLVLGKYHKTQRDAPEALLLYAHCKSLRSLDTSHECGAIISIAVRHAYQLGYHRDPDIIGKFTVFEGEMRRRFWACCKQVDTMISFQLGLPSNINFDDCDTKSPLHLLDTDFDTDTRVLPCARPENEPTAILWFIVKDRLMPVFSNICQAAWSLRSRPEAEVMELDAEVKRAYSSIPDVLRWHPVAKSIEDPPFLIMCRLFLELLYSKSLCILHRRYMDRCNDYSVSQCVEAASSIVRGIADVHRAFQPGGHLQAVSWMFKSIAMTDFLLGATILCFYIHLRRRGRISLASTSMVEQKDVLLLLEEARLVCLDRSTSSADARKVGLAIQITLGSAEGTVEEPTQSSDGVEEEVRQQTLPDVTSSDLSISSNVFTGQHPYSESYFIFNEFDPFNFLIDTSADAEMPWDPNAFPDFNILQ
ncbi:zn 2cys6 transcription factor [Stagonosporopsis vannaccii]|nr:zn 2cys6 transcription factor [Stagonosporopsis vannaccii]